MACLTTLTMAICLRPPDGVTGNALVCYGSGSYEYHTYADTMDRFNEESLGVSVIAYGTYIRHLAWPVFE